MITRITFLMIALCMPFSLWAASIDGKVDWAERVTLGTPVSGVVAEINAQPGQQVKKGDVLLRLGPADYESRIKRARAAVTKTRTALAEAEREWERAQELYERQVTSDHELKTEGVKYQTARANHAAASAELAMAEKALRDSTIRAPFDGIIIGRHISVAETAITRQQNVPMITMGMTGRYHAVASVDAATAESLANGMSVKVETAGQVYDGKVIFVAVEPENGSYTIKADFDTADILRIGTSATIVTP